MPRYAVGIDVGGTKIAGGLVDENGRVVARYFTREHAETEPQNVIDKIVETFTVLLQTGAAHEQDIAAVGVGFPSPVDAISGKVSSCSNLPGWKTVSLRDILAQRMHMPVLLDNDAHMAAAGEHRFGAGKGFHDLCYLCFSTGFGLGIVIDDQVYIGHRGMAGEVSHIVIEVDGPQCTCGKKGCLMTYASGIGIARQVNERIARGEPTILTGYMPADGRRIGGDVVAQAALEGDRIAKEVLDRAGYYFGVGISILVELLNPQLFIIGGGLSQIGAPLLNAVERGLHANTHPEMLEDLQLVPARLGADVGMVGAAAQVFACMSKGQMQRFSRP